MGTLTPENCNPTSVGAFSKVPGAMRLYYRGRRQADQTCLVFIGLVGRPCLSASLVSLSTYLPAPDLLCALLFSLALGVSRFAQSFTVITFSPSLFLSLPLSLSQFLGSDFYPKGKGRDIVLVGNGTY